MMKAAFFGELVRYCTVDQIVHKFFPSGATSFILPPCQRMNSKDVSIIIGDMYSRSHYKKFCSQFVDMSFSERLQWCEIPITKGISGKDYSLRRMKKCEIRKAMCECWFILLLSDSVRIVPKITDTSCERGFLALARLLQK